MKYYKKINNWLKRKIAILSIAISNVEKNTLTQSHEYLPEGTNKFQRQNQGKLSDSLINGEITEEVLNLKWRTYKILKASEGVKAEIIGYDEDGIPITRVSKRDNKAGLKKIKLDPYDDYKLELVLDNYEVTLGSGVNDEYFNIYNETTINYDGNNKAVSASHGEIGGVNYYASNKADKPIRVVRDVDANFKLENYTKKLNVRVISENKRLLEFCVSQYPDEYNRTSRLFLSAIKKQMSNPMIGPILEIKEVEFVSYKTTGVGDYLEFNYEIDSFDKIIEFNGCYLIKFIATVKVNGRDITEIHRVEELDKKYKNKQKK